MILRAFVLGVFSAICLTVTSLAGPVIDPIANVTIPAGKSLIVPITATSTNGRPLTYTVTSGNVNSVAVVMHTNNPFWQLTVVQAAPVNAPGAYKTPFRGSLVSATNVGTMTFMLFPEYAPHTINIFQGLTYSGFYNSNTIFHQTVANTFIQGGDPNTNGTGGLTFVYNDEFNPEAIFSGNGQLGLEETNFNDNGSQFFITIGPQRGNDFSATLFGQLVRGFPVLTNISATATDTNSRPLANEIIQTARYVTNTTDTVLTLTATNISGAAATITVIADDGAGGRTTNTFTATAVTDAEGSYQPFFYPLNTVTNVVAPKGVALTNYINGLELQDDAISWIVDFVSGPADDPTSGFNTVLSKFNPLTYNVVNSAGMLQLDVVPTNTFVGPLSVIVENYNEYDLDYFQTFNFVFGDTPITGQTNSFTVLAATSFTNSLLATFTNGVAGSAATNFSAAINWGDDTITAGKVTTNAAGQKVVLGAHDYPWPGSYPVYVQVQSSIGATATVLSYVNALGALPKLSLTSTNVFLTNGFAISLQLPEALSGSIQVSTNLTTWTTLTNFVSTNSPVTFFDPVTNAPRRFYRAVIP